MSSAGPRQDICAIIPCYNEGASIGRIVRAVQLHVACVLVIDDCSSDATRSEAQAAGAIVLRHETNQGKGAALKTGFLEAVARGFAGAVTLDGDGQHDTDEIPSFVQAFDGGNTDIVLGNRMLDTRDMPTMRRWTNQFTSWLISRMVGATVMDSQCGFRLISLAFWQAVRLDSSRFDLESEILIKALRGGARIAQVPVRTIYFAKRKSKINPVTDSIRFLHLLWRCRNA